MKLRPVCAHACGILPGDHNYNYNKQITVCDAERHHACESVPLQREGYMLWILAVIMGGLGFGYVTVRRRRKAEQKTA